MCTHINIAPILVGCDCTVQSAPQGQRQRGAPEVPVPLVPRVRVRRVLARTLPSVCMPGHGTPPPPPPPPHALLVVQLWCGFTTVIIVRVGVVYYPHG